jgi:hypothetical protein
MSVRNMTLKTGGTNSVSGGSDLVFADDGTTIQNGVHISVPATADYRVRQNATLKYKAPTLLADGTYTRDKKEVSYTVPLVRADGKVVFNVIRISREVDPEMGAAAVLDLNTIAAQLLFDSDMTNFWAAGSLS